MGLWLRNCTRGSILYTVFSAQNTTICAKGKMEEKEYEFICLYVHKVLLKDTWKNYNIGCP